MPDSAPVGLTPITASDKVIYRAIEEVYPALFTIVPPKGPVSHQKRATGMIAGTSFAIAFVIIITGMRVWTRLFRTHAFGADDVVIIPAAVGCLAYLSLCIAQQTAGCLGSHLWDCTYREFGWFYEVRVYRRLGQSLGRVLTSPS